jgi:hypothetical protein
MKESHRKGLTHHPDPESCAGRREAGRRSVDRGTCRPGMELRNPPFQSADDVARSEGHIRRGVRWVRVSRAGTLRSRETPGMYGHSTRENRETPGLPAARSAVGRAAKAQRQTAAMYGPGESDGGVVPTNDPNNEGLP